MTTTTTSDSSSASSRPTTDGQGGSSKSGGPSKGALGFLRDEGVFIAQIMFSTTALLFSIGMLVRGEDPAMYLPVLTATLGYWTPNPRTHHGQQAAFDTAMTSALRRATDHSAAAEAHFADVQHPDDDIPMRLPLSVSAGSSAHHGHHAHHGDARISVMPILPILPIRATRTI